MAQLRALVRKITAETQMSVGSVETILHEHLNMLKISARRTSRLLTHDQKQVRKEISHEILNFFNEDPEDFL